jgi:HEAT repeat protein
VETRRAAATRLGDRAKPDAVVPLISVLENDSDSTVRQAAARALAKLGDSRSIPALSNALTRESPGDNRFETLKALVEALGSLGRLGHPDAIPALITGLDDTWIANDAAEALRAIGWAPVTVSDQVRLALARGDHQTLANLAPKAVGMLVAVVREEGHERFRHRRAAARALGESGDSRVVPILVAALDNADVRSDAAGALSHLGWTPSTPEECARHAEATNDVAALSRLGEAGVAGLARLALGCGLPVCFPCSKYGKYHCPDCDQELHAGL